MKKLLIFLVVFLISPVFANDEPDVFPISTEMQIGKIKNLVDKAPKGIYLTVGGERAFRGASQFEGIEYLMVFDISPIIIRYDKINIELLKAKNKEQYTFLRWESEFSEWQKISNALTNDDFVWWNDHIRNIKGYDVPEVINKTGHSPSNRYIELRTKLLEIYPKVSSKFNNRKNVFLEHVTWGDIEENQKNIKAPISKELFDYFQEERKLPNSCVMKFIKDPSTAVDWGQIIDYKSGNYLFDDKLYERLHRLAVDKKIIVIEADMTKKDGLNAVIQQIQKLKLKLAVLDLDNLYLYEYMGEEKFRVALSQLVSFGDGNSILILMHNYKDYPCAQFSIYVGFTFENVNFWPKGPFFDAFINTIPIDVQALIDGRLYEGKDQLPFYLMHRDHSYGG